MPAAHPEKPAADGGIVPAVIATITQIAKRVRSVGCVCGGWMQRQASRFRPATPREAGLGDREVENSESASDCFTLAR